VRSDLGGWILLDPCTFADNPTGASSFYTAADDGLSRPWWTGNGWEPHSIYVNPPYGKAREPWVERCIGAAEHGARVILLIPAATDTRIFQRAASTSTAVVFVRGRVKFGSKRDNGRQHAASHPSALIGWNTDLAACASLGLLVEFCKKGREWPNTCDECAAVNVGPCPHVHTEARRWRNA
jgi:hypothetical protein